MSFKCTISEGKGFHIYYDTSETDPPFSSEPDHLWFEIDDTYWSGDSDGTIKVLILRKFFDQIVVGFLKTNTGERILGQLLIKLAKTNKEQEQENED